MKQITKILIIIILLTILIYVSNITNIPNSIILFQGEELQLNTVLGVDLKQENSYKTVQTSTVTSTKLEGKEELQLSLFNIPIKDITVNVIPKTTVIPVGNVIGLKLYTKGVLVVGMSEINGEDVKETPYKNSGIKEGDTIISVNNKEIKNTQDLIETVNKSKGNEINIKYSSNGEVKVANILPSKTKDNEYKLGLWIRDAAAGVGTVTFYEPSTNTFAALGHGVQDIDTEKLITIASGEAVTADIVEITKGEPQKPGEIKGSITNGNVIGNVFKNTKFGIYGNLENNTSLGINKNNEIEVALRNEIKIGEAKIICMLENNQKEEYSIEIQKIYKNNNENNKSMIIKVTDKRLLEKTGGIIQRNVRFSNNTKR